MLPVALHFIAMVAHAINERMARRVDYLQEVRVLKEALAAATGKTRIDFSPERRRLSWLLVRPRQDHSGIRDAQDLKSRESW